RGSRDFRVRYDDIRPLRGDLSDFSYQLAYEIRQSCSYAVLDHRHLRISRASFPSSAWQGNRTEVGKTGTLQIIQRVKIRREQDIHVPVRELSGNRVAPGNMPEAKPARPNIQSQPLRPIPLSFLSNTLPPGTSSEKICP